MFLFKNDSWIHTHLQTDLECAQSEHALSHTHSLSITHTHTHTHAHIIQSVFLYLYPPYLLFICNKYIQSAHFWHSCMFLFLSKSLLISLCRIIIYFLDCRQFHKLNQLHRNKYFFGNLYDIHSFRKWFLGETKKHFLNF